MGEVKLTPKFSVGDEVVRIAGGEWFGLREGDSATVVEVIDTPQNWHQIRLEGYQGLYSDFNFRLVRATTPTDQATIDRLHEIHETVGVTPELRDAKEAYDKATDQADLEVVAWRVKDFADGWMLSNIESAALSYQSDGHLVQPLVTLSQVTTLLAEKDAEIADLKHDIERYVEANSAQLAEIERLTRELDMHEAALSFVRRWTWHKEGNGTSDAERLSAIKHHPAISEQKP